MQSCEFLKLVCSLCGAKKQRKSYQEHVDNCDFRQVECVAFERCQTKVLFRDLKKHETTCGSVIINCPRCKK